MSLKKSRFMRVCAGCVKGNEATASLDVENETAIQQALSRLIQNKTVLIIAHRMRTVSGADKVVVLADGIVKEQGMPDELLKLPDMSQ